MRKLLGVLAGAAIVFSLILPPVAAQEVVSAKASRVTIGGYIDFDAVYRDEDIFDFGGSQDEHFVNTDLSIELTIDMTDNVSAFIQIRDDWVRETEFDDFSFDDDPAAGALRPANTWSNDGYNLEIEQAYIEVREFLVPELDLRIGIQNLVWDLRGNGDEFLLNVNENHVGESPLEAGAWKATYDADTLTIEAFAATLRESLGSRTDLALYGGRVVYPFDDMSKGVLGLLVANDNSVQMYSVDIGIDYWLNEDLELYAEGVWQFGDWGPDPDNEFDAEGVGGYVGGMYTFSDVEWTPSIDVSYWYLSGDDDSGDTDQEAFISLEDVDTFAIIEENHYGWDFDSNYEAVKVCASAQAADDVTLDLKVGWFKLVEDVASEDDLGVEVDASITWQYSENLAFTGLVAYLTGSDVIEAMVGGPDADDSGLLAAFSTVLVF